MVHGDGLPMSSYNDLFTTQQCIQDVTAVLARPEAFRVPQVVCPSIDIHIPGSLAVRGMVRLSSCRRVGWVKIGVNIERASVTSRDVSIRFAVGFGACTHHHDHFTRRSRVPEQQRPSSCTPCFESAVIMHRTTLADSWSRY